MRKVLGLVTLVIFIASCGKNELHTLENSKVLRVVDSIVFDEAYGISEFASTVIEGEEFLLMGNFRTHRELRVFDKNVELVKTFDLKAFDNLRGRIQAVDLVDLKTAVVILNNSDRIFFLNDEGYIFKVISLEKELDSLNARGVIRNYSPPVLLPDKNSMYLYVNAFPPLRDMDDYSLEMKVAVNATYLYQPRIIYIKDINSDNPKVELKMDSLYAGVLESDALLIMPHHITASSGKYLSAIEYSNKLKVFNENFELENTFTVESDFCEIGFVAPTVAGYKERVDDYKENAKQKNMLQFAFKDEGTGNYINVLTNFVDEEGTETFPNLIIYSENWEKLEEINCPDHLNIDFSLGDGRYYLKRKKSNTYDVIEFIEN